MPERHQGTSRWVIRVVVYVMLLASAGAAFLLNEWLWQTARQGKLPLWAPLLPVGMFTAFVVVYLVDRWLLVRRRHYPPLRAFFQVAIAVAFLALLWPHQASELRRSRARTAATGITKLLGHSDPELRAAGCELAAYRGETDALARIETLAASDASNTVRETCALAARRLRGEPLP